MLFALRAFCALVMTIAGLAGGFQTRAFAASGRLQFESGGSARTAFLVEHERLKRGPRATIIILHGGSSSGLRVRRNLGLEDQIRSEGVVVVYPDAVNGTWDQGDAGSHRDIQMLRDLVRKLTDERITDRRRVYLLGISTGGMLALRFACEDAPALAAVGAVISALPEPAATACKPAKPLATILLVGTADPFVPYGGGTANLRDFKGAVASVDATLAPFKASAGCGDIESETQFADKDPKDQSKVFLDKYKGCKTPVELVRVEGGGHTLPGRGATPTRDQSAGPRNNDIDAARVIWDFLRKAGA